MNFSLPPTPLEDAFKGNTLTGTKIPEIEHLHFLNEWARVNGRYNALKSKKVVGGDQWSDEMDMEFKILEVTRAGLFATAKEKGIIGKGSSGEKYAQELKEAEEKKERFNKLSAMNQRSLKLKAEIAAGTATPEMIEEFAALEKELEEPRKQAREALQAAGLTGTGSSSTAQAPVAVAAGS